MNAASIARPGTARAGSRVDLVTRWFGLRRRVRALCPNAVRIAATLPAPGEILLIRGASGSGKSTLLRRLRDQRHARRWIDLMRLRLANRPVVECFGRLPLDPTLRLLSSVGLAEAHTYIARPPELSDGQRWRLRLAMALYRAQAARSPTILACDEFAALLDRITARIVAYALRCAIDRCPHLSAVVATSHDDLVESLRPDRIIRCDF